MAEGEKPIPSKSAVITIDDEWNSQYYVAWPIIKEFSNPFTLFVYTQWVNTGGKSMTWAQLEEMRDAGADILLPEAFNGLFSRTDHHSTEADLLQKCSKEILQAQIVIDH